MRESGVLPGRSGSSSVESPNQRRDPLASPCPTQAESERGTWTDGRVRWSQGIQGLEVLLDQVALIFNPDR